MPKEILVTFHLTKGQMQQIIYEQSQSVLQNRLRKDISNENFGYLDINGIIIFIEHIKSFNVVEIN